MQSGAPVNFPRRKLRDAEPDAVTASPFAGLKWQTLRSRERGRKDTGLEATETVGFRDGCRRAGPTEAKDRRRSASG